MQRDTVIIINEQHKMLPNQVKLLPEGYKEVKVPAKGWTISEMNDQVTRLKGCGKVIFVSPIPFMIKQLAIGLGHALYDGWKHHPEVKVFHNDKREKKELPNGKVVMAIAEEGWQLV